MTKTARAGAEEAGDGGGQPISRRSWLHGAAFTAVGVSAAGLPPVASASAQAPPLSDVIRGMTAVTGVRIEENWVGPTAVLVGVILDYSKGLRGLDLGDLEPPTDFLIR